MAGGKARGASTTSPAEAAALAARERAKRAQQAPQPEPETEEEELSAQDLADFRAWQAEKERRAAADAVGVQGISFEPSKQDGLLAFAIVGEMPDKPSGTKGAYLNSNSKVIMNGEAYTLLVSLFPYKGVASVQKLKAQGDVVGEHKG